MPDYQPFRAQAEAKAPWELSDDSKSGFSQALHNNQMQMALFYLQNILKEYESRIIELEAKIESLVNKPAPKTTAAAKKTADEV